MTDSMDGPLWNGAIDVTNNAPNNGVVAGIVNYYEIPRIKPSNSAIAKVVKAVAKVCEDDSVEYMNKFEPYDIAEKIDFNSVIKYRDIINDHSIYSQHCEQIILALDNNRVGIKNKILRWINNNYKEVKGQILFDNRTSGLSEMDIIRENADLIIDKMTERVKNLIVSSSDNNFEDCESRDNGITCFVCYCFMDCKILEEPRR